MKNFIILKVYNYKMNIKTILFFLAFLTVFSNFSYGSYKCSDMSLEQITPNIVCDGSNFELSLNYNSKNPWGDYIVARLYPSRNIQISTFPEVDLRSIIDDKIIFKASCKDINTGYIEARILNEDQDLCILNLDLENLVLPQKTSDGSIIIDVDKKLQVEPEYISDENINYLLILIGITIFIMFFLIFIIFYPFKSKRFKNDKK